MGLGDFLEGFGGGIRDVLTTPGVVPALDRKSTRLNSSH